MTGTCHWQASVGVAIVVGMCMRPVDLPAVQATTEKPATDSYRKVEVTDRDVQAALKFAVADQQRKENSRPKLLSIISAEHQFVSSDNFRLCLYLDRGGRTEFAQVVVSRNAKKRWSMTIWSWGACRR